MKDAATYEKKISKLLKTMAGVPAGELPTGPDATAVLVLSVLEADTTDKDAQKALDAINEEYVDFNELRVSPSKDIADCVGKQIPNARDKARMITAALNGIYHRTYNVHLDYMAEMSKRDLRRHLEELGLSPYAAGSVVLRVFAGHAIPVDDTLVEVLKMDGYVAPDSDQRDVQGFLTRIVAQKDALSVHRHLRQYVAGSAKALAKTRQRQQEAQARAEAAAKAEAKARRAVQAKKAAKARRAAKAKAAAEAKKDAAKAKTAKAVKTTKAKAKPKAAKTAASGKVVKTVKKAKKVKKAAKAKKVVKAKAKPAGKKSRKPAGN